MSNIIITGRAGAGKSTVAKMLEEEYGYERYALADPIKQITENMLQADLDEVGQVLYTLFADALPEIRASEVEVANFLWYIRNKYECALRTESKPRAVYQELGQGMRKLVHKDCWIYLLASQIDHSKPFVVEDIRLPNEFAFFSRMNNTLSVRIFADEQIRLQRLKLRDGMVDKNALNHETEHYCDKFPCRIEIDNNGTMEELKEKVQNLVENEYIWGWHRYE